MKYHKRNMEKVTDAFWKSNFRRVFQKYFMEDLTYLFNALHNFFGCPSLQT